MAVNLFALLMFVAFATIQYNAMLSNLTHDRLVVLADTTQRSFKSVADLGIPLGTVRNADAMLARVASSDEAIIGIHVLSPEGEIARSTNMPGDAFWLADVGVASRAAGPSETWHLETGDEFLVGVNMEGALLPNPAGAVPPGAK